MSESMPWDEYRDTGDDELAAELAEIELEEAEWLAWVDAIANEEPGDPDLAVLATRPGLAKAYCRHGAYDFALDAETQHAICRTCGHSWLIVPDYLLEGTHP
jgi:hypothetical protein